MNNFESFKNKGLGWKSIFLRVQMLNGKIGVQTEQSKGTKIDINLPL